MSSLSVGVHFISSGLFSGKRHCTLTHYTELIFTSLFFSIFCSDFVRQFVSGPRIRWTCNLTQIFSQVLVLQHFCNSFQNNSNCDQKETQIQLLVPISSDPVKVSREKTESE